MSNIFPSLLTKNQLRLLVEKNKNKHRQFFYAEPDNIKFECVLSKKKKLRVGMSHIACVAWCASVYNQLRDSSCLGAGVLV